MGLTNIITAFALAAIASVASASAQMSATTHPDGITLSQLRGAVLASGGQVIAEEQGFLIVRSPFGQQFIATLESCARPPRCRVVYMGTRVSNQSGQTLSTINRLNTGPGMARFIWVDSQRADLDSRFIVDQGISTSNLVLNVAFYSVELDAFFKVMTRGVSASLDGQDPRTVIDGDLTIQQVGLRDQAMASFLNKVPAPTAASLAKQTETLLDDEAKAALMDELLDRLEQGEEWSAQ